MHNISELCGDEFEKEKTVHVSISTNTFFWKKITNNFVMVIWVLSSNLCRLWKNIGYLQVHIDRKMAAPYMLRKSLLLTLLSLFSVII